MTMQKKRFMLKTSIAAAALVLTGAVGAQQKTVTFANQDMLVPMRLVMESGEVEKETGYKINWRMFSGGGDVIRAMASGDVQMGELAAITALGLDTFNEAVAKEYAAKAKEELAAAGATFPIKILTSYNPNVSSWAEECQVVEQQLEALLGSDFIDIIIEAGPSTGFLSAVRRSGQYALLKANWGPDYADPETYTDPFARGGSYNFPEFTTDTDAEGNNKFEVYEALVKEAKAITDNLQARYEAFAKAEAYLINEAFIVPFGYGNGGYIAARINPFEGQYAPFGISNERYKGQRLLEEPMNTDRYFDAMDKWEEERAALSK